MASAPSPDALQHYEQRAFARYFVHDIHFPLLGMALLCAVSAWLLHGRVPEGWIAAWLVLAVAGNAGREGFLHWVRPRLEAEQRHALVLQVFVGSSVVTGVTWGLFVAMYLDPTRSLNMLIAGSFVAGLIGVSVTPLSIWPPAFYAFALPIVLPYGVLMLRAGGTEPLTLAALSLVYLGAMASYAQATHRLHRETMRLRFDNQALIEDLSARKADAENASRTKGLFLAGVSHDLKQPVRAITLYTGFLRHANLQALGEDKLRQTLDKIEAAASAVHHQISRLLELSRLQSGTLTVNLVPVDVAELLAGVQALLSPDAQARGVQLHVARTGGHRVLADRRMLESVVQNLLSNAIKHSQGQRVYVGTRWRPCEPTQGHATGMALCIEVRDNGVGIEPQRLAQLFDAYRSFDDQHGRDSHGLGLAIARAQATYLGCDIAVASQPGRGSTFTLCGLMPA